MTVTIIRCILVLIVLPFLMGNGFLGLIQEEKSIVKAYVFGWFSFWAAGQIMLVPMILGRVAFSDASLVWTLFALLMALCGLFTRSWPKRPCLPKTGTERLAIFIMLISIGVFFALTVLLQHTDDDDARFVVNAVDILRTNTMFLTNPATGEPVPHFMGELCKDVLAPWAVFIAWCAKWTGIHPTIMAHSVLPLALYLTGLCVWWLLAEVFFQKDILHKCIFLCLVLFIHVYGYYSKRSAESFFILRIWQGKADVAAIGIPLAIWCMMQCFDKKYLPGPYLLLAVIQLSMCFMSSMGIVIGTLLLGCFGFMHGILLNDFKVTFRYWVLCLPAASYYLVYQSLLAAA